MGVLFVLQSFSITHCNLEGSDISLYEVEWKGVDYVKWVIFMFFVYWEGGEDGHGLLDFPDYEEFQKWLDTIGIRYQNAGYHLEVLEGTRHELIPVQVVQKYTINTQTKTHKHF